MNHQVKLKNKQFIRTNNKLNKNGVEAIVGEGGPKLDTVSSWTPLLKVDRIKTKIFKQAYLM